MGLDSRSTQSTNRKAPRMTRATAQTLDDRRRGGGGRGHRHGRGRRRATARPRRKTTRPAVTLEFAPREVVQPVWATMPAASSSPARWWRPTRRWCAPRPPARWWDWRSRKAARVKAGQSLGRIDLAELQSRSSERQASADVGQGRAGSGRTHACIERAPGASSRSSRRSRWRPRARSSTARARCMPRPMAQRSTPRASALREAALVAPIGGIVARRHVVPGEKVSVEQTLLTIVDLATPGARRPGRHARGGAPATRHAGAGARRGHGRAGDRAACAHRAGGRAGHALDRRDDRARQPERDACAPASTRWRAWSSPTTRAASRCRWPRWAAPSGQDHVWVIADGALLRRAVTTGRRDDRAAAAWRCCSGVGARRARARPRASTTCAKAPRRWW